MHYLYLEYSYTNTNKNIEMLKHKYIIMNMKQYQL
jgi:hypothetical protein